jgi:ADP-ribosylation factor-like protein 8
VLQVAAKELMALLAKPSLDGIPLLVLGNKNDLPGALGTQQLIQQLELQVGQDCTDS